jgi:hypothetical protein
MLSLFTVSGPLAAIIKAQAMAAQSTADFIKSIGLDENNNVINVDFDYEVLNATSGEKYTNTLTVPLLTIVPIPFIKVSNDCRSDHLQVAVIMVFALFGTDRRMHD